MKLSENARTAIEILNSNNPLPPDETDRLAIAITIGSLLEVLGDRTIALQQAIGIAQQQTRPHKETYNRWRRMLGWHEVD